VGNLNETPFFFKNGNYSLFAVFHAPMGTTRGGPFVFCHPFGEEKLWTHRVFVSFARQLAAEGYPVLRFDYMGNGDSDGEFSESSLETVLSDTRSAIAETLRRTGAAQVSMLGLRFGALVACLAAEESRAAVDRLILWAPITDGARYMQDLLRINLTTQMATGKAIAQDREALVEAMRQGATVNVDGYPMALPLYSEVSAVKLASAAKHYSGPCLVSNVDRQPGRPVPDLQQLAGQYARGTLIFAQEEPFWKEIARFYDEAPNLFGVTREWLHAQ
jgi:exosortase A-associated hydrolase 2